MTTVFPISSATPDRPADGADRPDDGLERQQPAQREHVPDAARRAVEVPGPDEPGRQHAVPHPDRAVHRGRDAAEDGSGAGDRAEREPGARGVDDDRSPGRRTRSPPSGGTARTDARRASSRYAARSRATRRSARPRPRRTDVYTEQGAKVPLELDFTKTATGWTVQASTQRREARLSRSPITFDATGDHTTNDVTIPSRRARRHRRHRRRLAGDRASRSASARRAIRPACNSRADRRPSPSPNRTATTARPRPASSPACT